MRSIQATPQYIPFILKNSDMAYSKSSGSWPYLKRQIERRKLSWEYSSIVQSWNLLYLAMNPACWSSRREVGAFLGITASFTRTAMVSSTLKNAESFKDTSHPVLSIHPRHLSHPRQIEVIPLISKLEPETSLSLHVPCPLPSVSSVTPLKTNIICKCRR